MGGTAGVLATMLGVLSATSLPPASLQTPTGAGAFWSSRAAVPQRPAASFRSVVQLTRRAVVSIQVTSASTPEGSTAPDRGIGTGFIIHPSGLVLTNFHVVTGARDIQVTVDDGRRRQTLPASVLGMDEDADLALLRIDAGRPLPTLALGDSDSVAVGDWVVAEGTPFGLSQSVSFGVISYVDRSDVAPAGHDGFRGYLQTDAAINPGSSGGPVLDVRGRVVGVADAVNTSAQGIGFAVPINMAKAVLPDLLRLGRAERAWLGVQVRDLTPDRAEALNLDDERGVEIVGVDDPGPAQAAGLMSGDVVVRFHHRRVRNAQDLRWLAASAPVGQPVEARVYRQGHALIIPVTLVRSTERSLALFPLTELKATLRPLDVPTARAAGLPLPNGAEVVGVDASCGLKPGDVVTAVGSDAIAKPNDLEAALRGPRTGPLTFSVRRAGQPVTVVVQVP